MLASAEPVPPPRRLALLAVALSCAALGLSACGGGASGRPPADAGWTSFGGTPDAARFSPLTQVDRGSVGKLGVAWTFTQDRRLGLWETFPVVAGATMYLTTNTGEVLALDATTGRRRWSYAPDVDFLAAGGGAEVSPVHRGVAVGAGRVYLLTYDEQLTALSARTGRVLWTTQAADTGRGYAGTSPPTYAAGRLYAGSSGSETKASRGFVAAFDAATGRRLWRTSTVPASTGGGRVWMPPTVDTATGTVYAGTGNPSPALAARSGCTRWASGIVALDAATGRVRWGASEVCGDVWDYDGGQPPLLYQARRDGRLLAAVAHVNKSSLQSLRDARSGALLATPRTLVRQRRPRPDARGQEVCPGALGGVAYSPAAFSPRTRALYQPVADVCMVYRTGNGGPGGSRVQLGGGSATVDRSAPATGAVVAVDADTGRTRWRRALPAPAVGGALATAGGLVFTGCDDGLLYALDARTGGVVRRWRIGLAFGSAPFTYRVDGVQYVAVVAGGSSLAPLTGAATGGRLVVLAIGGRPLSGQ
jgi:alcohol dehydrogenase (cytochrome c)